MKILLMLLILNCSKNENLMTYQNYKGFKNIRAIINKVKLGNYSNFRNLIKHTKKKSK